MDQDILAELSALGEGAPPIDIPMTHPVIPGEFFGHSLVEAKEILGLFMVEAMALKNAVFNLTIKDQTGSAVASEHKATAQKIIKKIDAQVKVMTEDATDYVQAVRNFAANLKAPLTDAKAEADRKITLWAQYVRIEREKQERAATEALAKAQAAINKAAEKKGIEPVILPEPKLPPAKTVIRTDTGTTFEVRKWRGNIIHPGQIERQYCSPDPAKIREAIDGGMRNPDMAGVDIFEDVTMVTRTK